MVLLKQVWIATGSCWKPSQFPAQVWWLPLFICNSEKTKSHRYQLAPTASEDNALLVTFSENRCPASSAYLSLEQQLASAQMYQPVFLIQIATLKMGYSSLSDPDCAHHQRLEKGKKQARDVDAAWTLLELHDHQVKRVCQDKCSSRCCLPIWRHRGQIVDRIIIGESTER